MSYQIEITPAARREIRALPGYVRSQAIQLIEELSRDPRPARAIELRDRENILRIWLAGRWRIIYEVDDELVIVLILRVRRKEDIDYRSV
ncbi:MAG: type II toxin-antitoxin system RelE/ParE family toxin [Anaerolinea sp.]|nr:type II toxin-antitoxin system RelE/ParE family toxin [Anaerolinea sp.]